MAGLRIYGSDWCPWFEFTAPGDTWPADTARQPSTPDKPLESTGGSLFRCPAQRFGSSEASQLMSKPVALISIVAENRMIGHVDDTPLPFNISTLMDWLMHMMAGADGSEKPLKHSVVFGRRVYEEFMGRLAPKN